MEEQPQVNSSELLELVSGLRAKDDENGIMDQEAGYRKGGDCLCELIDVGFFFVFFFFFVLFFFYWASSGALNFHQRFGICQNV
jgi:hypothetical protein